MIFYYQRGKGHDIKPQSKGMKKHNKRKTFASENKHTERKTENENSRI